MAHIEQSILIKTSIERAFHFHDDTKNLLKITPPNVKVTFETRGESGLGQEVMLQVRQFGLFTMHWHVKITEYQPPHRMTDIQISGPFKSWKQTRLFREVNDSCMLTDIVEYEPPFGVLGRIADALFIRPQIMKMFAFRQQATKQLLESV
ncbi:MAG: SRPBCC family protein [Candidatus Kapabacteria bacterium]|nr:SRPBCC family protein [Candidatus Kapabacteria bacterium]